MTAIRTANGKWAVANGDSVLAGSFETSAEVRRWIGRQEGSSISRAEQTSDTISLRADADRGARGERRDIGGPLPQVSTSQRGALTMSKEEVRLGLVAGYGGLVERVPAGARAISEAVPDQQRGRISREIGKVKRGRGAAVRPLCTLDTAVPPGLVIYADGACEPNPGIGGWGFVVYRDDVEIHSDCGGENPATNNTMEITGALMALRWIADRGIVEPVRILCDSMYVVNGANDWRHSWKARGWRRKGKNPEIANLALWQELDRLLTLVPIKLEWCKGHAGIIGNERADELSLIGREAALAAEASDCGDLILEQMRYAVA